MVSTTEKFKFEIPFVIINSINILAASIEFILTKTYLSWSVPRPDYSLSLYSLGHLNFMIGPGAYKEPSFMSLSFFTTNSNLENAFCS